MGFYLFDHPPRVAQGRTPRRAKLSGMVGVHTSEGVMDNVGVDTGAENVAAFIAQRSDYGSYHCIVDSDSAVRLLPDDWEAWHIGADLHNWHSWGISAACRTTDWDLGSVWTPRTITRMGAEICAFWLRNGFDPVKLAGRWLTREEALRHEPGLIEHGCAQPADRTDAWFTRPDRTQLRAALTHAILTAAGGNQPEPSEDDMALNNDDLAKIEALIDSKIAAAVTQINNATGTAVAAHLGNVVAPGQISQRTLTERIYNGVAAVVQHTGADTDQPLPPTKVMS